MKTSREEKQVAPWNDPTVRWVCEEHPDEDHEHLIGWGPFKRECGGAGMPKERCYFTDHEPVWCGDGYMCFVCYLPFAPKSTLTQTNRLTHITFVY